MKINQAGFTLIELLITIVIFTVLTALSYSALNTAIKQQNAQKVHHNQLIELQKTLHYLERDITQIYKQVVALNRSGLSIKSIQNEQLLKLNYSVSNAKLIRKDTTDKENIVALTLISGINDSSIRVLDNNNKWHKNWRNGEAYLKAIEIKFNHPAWGMVKKLVLLDE